MKNTHLEKIFRIIVDGGKRRKVLHKTLETMKAVSGERCKRSLKKTRTCSSGSHGLMRENNVEQ